MIKRIYALILILISAVLSFSQTYTFSYSSGSYTDLNGETKLSGNAGWLNFDYVVNLPFTFHFYNQDFSYVAIDNFGDVFFNNDYQYVFIAFGSIMLDRDTVNSISPISYKVEGNAGNRIVKIQYKNCGFLYSTMPAYINYQIWLYEGSNICEVHFGSSSIPSNSYAYAGQSGPQIGVYKSSFPEAVLCLKNDAYNPITSTVDNIDIFLTGTPPLGMVYTFAPTSTGISSNISDKTFAVFPNPATYKLNICSEEEIQTAVLYNLLGEKVVEQTPKSPKGDFENAKKVEIDLNGLPKGMYVVRVKGGDWEKTERVVKE